jgi:hypothetical protein
MGTNNQSHPSSFVQLFNVVIILPWLDFFPSYASLKFYINQRFTNLVFNFVIWVQFFPFIQSKCMSYPKKETSKVESQYLLN